MTAYSDAPHGQFHHVLRHLAGECSELEGTWTFGLLCSAVVTTIGVDTYQRIPRPSDHYVH